MPNNITNSTCDPKDQVGNQFSSATRWIWSSPEVPAAWWMFRKKFSAEMSAIATARLKITSALHHLVFLNGTLISRGPGKGFNFSKIFDDIDVRPFLKTNSDNIIAVLAVGIDPEFHVHRRINPKSGLIAELQLTAKDGSTYVVSSDKSWRAKRHLSFQDDTQKSTICSGQDEVFDARLEEQGWTLLEHDDSDWALAFEVGPIGTPPWTDMEKNTRGLLSNDAIYPVTFKAIELARLREGYHFRLGHKGHGVPCYFTEITTSVVTNIKLWGVAKDMLQAAVDGKTLSITKPVDRHSISESEEISLTAGKHLLAVSAGSEFDLQSSAPLQFSAEAFLGSKESQWACIPYFPANSYAEGWNSPSGKAKPEVELPRLFAVTCASELAETDRSRLVPAMALRPSVKLLVSGQRFFSVPGGYTDPTIANSNPRSKIDKPATMPLCNAHNLLHSHVDACTVLPQDGYDVHFVVDFDRLVIGYVSLELDAPAGTIVDVSCFETIDDEGIFWVLSYNTFRYVCRDGSQEFISNCRRGFRYLSVTIRNFNSPIQFNNIRCYHTAYPIQTIGSFVCNDELLNRIHKISIDTAALCLLDTHISCPTWEQSAWAGDATITGQISQLQFGAYDLEHHFVRMMGQNMTRPEWIRDYRPQNSPDHKKYTSGHFLPVANVYEVVCEIPAWAFFWIMQVWHLHLYSGNKKYLEENFEYVAQTLKNCKLLTNIRGLLDIPGAANLIDWGNNDLPQYGEVTVNNVLLVYCLRLAARMAILLGKDGIAAEYESEADTRKDAINRYCWDALRNAYVDTVRDEWAYEKYLKLCRDSDTEPFSYETYLTMGRISEQSNTLALMCDCVPENRKAAVVAIVERVEKGEYVAGGPFMRSIGEPPQSEAPDGIVAIGSPFFLYFTFKTLFELGKVDMALKIMRRDWGDMIKNDARTCWETFRRNDRWTTSICHSWSASPAIYLPTHILGIRPVEPGYKTFIIDPQPGDLTWAKGSVATPFGPIYVHWWKTLDGKLEVKWTAPPECKLVGKK